MYLTKIELDRRSPSVRQALRDCEDMHRNIQKMFAESRESAGVLYAVHTNRNALNLYMLSKEKPDGDNLPYGMDVAASKDLSEFEREFKAGQIHTFYLLAHPSKKVHAENAKNSHRIFISDRTQQILWLQRRGMAGGFEVISLQTKEGGTLYSNQKGKLKLPYVEYMGYLRITDSYQFCQTWKNGIGPEKAYGLGMLMIK